MRTEYEPIGTMRSRIIDEPPGLRIVIPARRNWFVVVFMTAWLCGWAFGEIAVIGALFGEGPPGALSLFLVVWLVGWTVGGLFAVYIVLWMLAGQEIVLLRPDALVVKRNVLGIGKRRAYDITKVERLRVVESDSGSQRPGSRAPGRGMFGRIAFDYGPKTVRFGASIEPGEARMLVDKLQERYPFDAEW